MKLKHALALLIVALLSTHVRAADEAKPQSLFDGKTLANWTAADFEGAGEPRVENGELILPFGERLTGVHWTGGALPRMNYEIALDAKRTDGSDFFCGLTFPYNESYASLIIGGWGGTLCGISSINGDDAAHNDTRTFQTLKDNTWYHVRMRVTPTKLQAWLDNEKIVDVATTGKQIDVRRDIDQSKPLGLATFQCSAAIKNITLTPVVPAPADKRVSTSIGDKPAVDARAEMLRTLYEGSGFKPYTDKAAWEQRKTFLRQQVLMAAGLWPMPEKTPLNAVVHGKVDKGDYTVEKVYFQSSPGFYVTGNLYRPKGKAGPFPGILSPHGHWKEGRFNETPEKEIQKQLEAGLEKDHDAAKYILQARCANLAKLGCVVFHYDMVGYADSDPRFVHRETFRDTESDLHSLSVFGLQTWDSVRSLDFIASLPDVDKSRLACTGASGGATQTFMLMAIDDRLAAAAPVCMISAGNHQGGCVCENNSLLRVGTDNVEIAATFAPKPFAHPSATGDWTKDFMEQGLQEIKATYALYGVTDGVRAFRQTAPHNYNLASREFVYNFFNDTFKLGAASPVKEQKFEPIAPKELSVFDDQHPRPADSLEPRKFKDQFIKTTGEQVQALLPKDKASLDRAREVLQPALRHMVFASLPTSDQVTIEMLDKQRVDDIFITKLRLHRGGDAQALPALWVDRDHTGEGMGNEPVTLVISADGKACIADDSGAVADWARQIAWKRGGLLVVDVYGTGELALPPKPPAKPIEFAAGYNRTKLANRVNDILTAIAAARRMRNWSIDLVGVRDAGPWVLLARPLAGDAVRRTFADVNEFDFDHVRAASDDNYLPGSLRSGGLFPLASLAAPAELTIAHPRDGKTPEWLTASYHAAGAADKFHVVPHVDVENLPDLLTK